MKDAGIQPKPDRAKAEDFFIQAIEGETEDELYERAMRDVVRARWRRSPAATPLPAYHPPPEIEREDERLMKEALEGNPPPQISDHPEYIEAWVGVAGRLYLPHLRGGLYSIQNQLDLHGLSRSEARRTVEEFVLNMSRFRSCCVKIIHGRGINSPNEQAVLKDSLQRWLTTRRMSRYVVAYASAPAKDGGVGAVYVLLKRRRQTK